ncbi:CP089 protein, partial [Polypterus senegalus]
MRSHLLLLLSCALVLFHGEGQPVEVSELLRALDKAVGFFQREFRQLNLDGVVGFGILNGKYSVRMDGFLSRALDAEWGGLGSVVPRICRSFPNLSPGLAPSTAELGEALRRWPHTDHSMDANSAAHVSKVRKLMQRLDGTLQQASYTLQESDPSYFREFEPILESGFWSLPKMWNTTSPHLVYSAFQEVACFSEQLSDKCIALLLGTWKDNGTPCIVTNSCRNLMTRFGCADYSLSHQLLYFMIGQMKGCSNILQGERRGSRINMTGREYERIFCSNMMKRNVAFENSGFPVETHDIFMENIMLCGMAGYSDFYKSSWLRRILAWQDPEEGCFGRHEGLAKSRMQERKVLEIMELHKRVKRREKTLHDGCSSHMTAVAVSALGGYLDYYQTEQDVTKRPLA